MNLRYIDQFLQLRCAPDLLTSGALPAHKPAKEISEIMGAFTAVRKALGAKAFGDRNTILLDVGCGRAPRAAAFFALMTRWTCIGVDPRVRRGARRVQRLYQSSSTIQDFVELLPERLGFLREAGHLESNEPRFVVVGIHSHAPLDFVWSLPTDEVLVVSIPCCTRDAMVRTQAPIMSYEDPFILSPKNRVYVWNVNPYK